MTDARPVGVALENRLMSHGVYLTDWEPIPPGGDADGTDVDSEAGDADRADDRDGSDTGSPPDGTGLRIEYDTVAETSGPGIDSDEVGAVVRTLLDVADEREWTPGRLEATARTTNGELRGRWHVERAWFEGLGLELDDLEFSRRVLGTRTAPADER